MHAQQFDITPPTLSNLQFAPTALDTTTASMSITLTATATDDLSGTAYAYVEFQSPGQQALTAYLYPVGTFVPNQPQALQGTLNFSPYNEAGNWTVTYAEVVDNVGNWKYYPSTDPLLSGLLPLNLTSLSDTVPPVLKSFEIVSPQPPIDVSAGAATILVNVEVTDSGSGAYSAPSVDMSNSFVDTSVSPAQYRSQYRSPVQYDVLNFDTVPSGSSVKYTRVMWQLTFVMPQYSMQGNWIVGGAIYDQVGNYAAIPSTTLAITDSNQDVTPPTLTAISIPYYATQQDPARVTVTALFSDAHPYSAGNYSIGCSPYVEFASQHGQYRSAGFSQIGDSQEWTATVGFPQYSEGNSWMPTVAFCDNIGNGTYLTLSNGLPAGTPAPILFLPGSTPVLIKDPTQPIDVEQPNLGADARLQISAGTSIVDSQGNIIVPSVADPLSVTIDTYSPPPANYSGANTANSLYMSIDFSQNGTTVQAPKVQCVPGSSTYKGGTITVPLRSPLNALSPPPGTWNLYHQDVASNQFVVDNDCWDVPAQPAVGTLNPDGMSVTFQHIASFSVFFTGLRTTPLGDINADGKVDCTDVGIVKAAFGTKSGQAAFDSRADVNGDGVINIQDLAYVMQHLPAGLTCH
jgi:hypothetical protein